MSKGTLRKAKPADLIRLGKWLKLDTDAVISHNQLANLIHWLITRHDKRSRGLTLY